MSTYETTNTASLALAEQYLYGSSRLGVLDHKGRSYELTDHLGNVRAVVDEFKEVRAAYEYYAFGMSLAKVDNGYRYGFNGKEKDVEFSNGMNDFDERIYDCKTCKFLTLDPLFFKYAEWSPYLFATNNPIRFIDVFGMGPGDRIKKAKSFLGTNYKQETNTVLRTAETDKALRNLDWAEMVCRVIAADELTDGIKHMHCGLLITEFAKEGSNWEEVETPQAGDIILWAAHTALVESYDEKTKKIKVIHATHYTNAYTKEVVSSVVEEEYKLSYYEKNKAKFYRPIKDTPDCS